MDVPYIAKRRAPQALIYANKTSARILAAAETGPEPSPGGGGVGLVRSMTTVMGSY